VYLSIVRRRPIADGHSVYVFGLSRLFTRDVNFANWRFPFIQTPFDGLLRQLDASLVSFPDR
jgi:hypothetical protein